MTADQSELEWLRDWRTRLLSAMRLWFNATGYRDGCDRLADLKTVFNEVPAGQSLVPPPTIPGHSLEGETR